MILHKEISSTIVNYERKKFCKFCHPSGITSKVPNCDDKKSPIYFCSDEDAAATGLFFKK